MVTALEARNAMVLGSNTMNKISLYSALRRRNCTLIVTHQCNLRCRYCYESRKDGNSMSFETARNILEKEFQQGAESPETDEIVFDFLGGEPFLEFPLIKSLCEWTWSKPRPIPFLFSATTNGTTLDNTVKQWLREHADRFKVVLSLDGTMSAQEENRPGSINKIDLDFFREVYGDQSLKMTISPETVGQFADGVIHLIKTGFLVAPSIAHGVNWTDDTIREYARQLSLLVDWFLLNRNCSLIPQFERSLAPVLDEEPIRRTCGTGRMMATYDVDGRAYPCHLFLPWITGRASGWDVAWGNENLCDNRCLSCSFARICKHCYGFNFSERGNASIRSRTACLLLKSEIAACVRFKGTRLGEKIRSGWQLQEDELREARAVLHLLNNPPISI